MSWFKVDDHFHASRKLLRVPRRIRLACAGLWVICGSWSAAEELDGYVPSEIVDEFGGTPELVHALVLAGLWTVPDDDPAGAVFVNWAEYQPTRAQLDEKRRQDRERMARSRAHRKASQRDTPVTPTVTDCDIPAPVTDVSRRDTARDTTVSHAPVTDVSRRDGHTPVTHVSHRDIANPQVTTISPELSQRDTPVSHAPVTDLSALPDPTRPDKDLLGNTSHHRAREIRADGSAHRCDEHSGLTAPPPCQACQDARLEDADHRADATARRRDELTAHAARRRTAIDDCDLCDDTGYRRGLPCSHDPGEDDRRARGIAAVRAALGTKS